MAKKRKPDQPKLFDDAPQEQRIRDDFPRHDVISLDAPIARNKDIASSKAAAKEITESGAREGQLRDALDLVRKHPGHTSLELTDFGTLDRYQLARRLPELERMGYARKGQIRLCRKGKRDAAPWYPVDQGQ